MIFEILSIVIGLYLFMIMYFHYKYPEIRWDWDTIQVDKVEFPKNFIWGTATAAHQVEGNCINKEYYENGIIKEEVSYSKGKLNGIFKDYFGDGSLKSEGNYNNGAIDGIVKEYFPTSKK